MALFWGFVPPGLISMLGNFVPLLALPQNPGRPRDADCGMMTVATATNIITRIM